MTDLVLAGMNHQEELNNSYGNMLTLKWQETPGEYWIINNSISSLLASCIYAYWAWHWVFKENVCVCVKEKQDTTESTSG